MLSFSLRPYSLDSAFRLEHLSPAGSQAVKSEVWVTRSKPMVSCGPPLPGVEVIVVVGPRHFAQI
jgi:hypothetical protein